MGKPSESSNLGLPKYSNTPSTQNQVFFRYSSKKISRKNLWICDRIPSSYSCNRDEADIPFIFDEIIIPENILNLRVCFKSRVGFSFIPAPLYGRIILPVKPVQLKKEEFGPVRGLF